jgi:uncharacterized protein YaiL (DUF2058 family)
MHRPKRWVPTLILALVLAVPTVSCSKADVEKERDALKAEVEKLKKANAAFEEMRKALCERTKLDIQQLEALKPKVALEAQKQIDQLIDEARVLLRTLGCE